MTWSLSSHNPLSYFTSQNPHNTSGLFDNQVSSTSSQSMAAFCNTFAPANHLIACWDYPLIILNNPLLASAVFYQLPVPLKCIYHLVAQKIESYIGPFYKVLYIKFYRWWMYCKWLYIVWVISVNVWRILGIAILILNRKTPRVMSSVSYFSIMYQVRVPNKLFLILTNCQRLVWDKVNYFRFENEMLIPMKKYRLYTLWSHCQQKKKR